MLKCLRKRTTTRLGEFYPKQPCMMYLESKKMLLLNKFDLYIENYYQFLNITGRTDKVVMVAEEVENIQNNPLNPIHLDGYQDIINCLIFAASRPKIDEARHVISEALSIVSPALYELNKSSTNEDMERIVRKRGGDVKSIFKLTVDQTREQPILNVDTHSNILEVVGFPIPIQKNGNPNVEIPAKIRSSS